MSDNVQFDTDVQNNAMYRPKPAAGFGQDASDDTGMTGWLLRHRIVKTRAAAQGIMIVVIIIDIVATFLIIKYFV